VYSARQKTYAAQYYKAHKLKYRVQSKLWCVNHPSFTNWDAMMVRCYNTKRPQYSNYGGQDVRVYKPWHIFSVYEQDFGCKKPGLRYTVDRIDSHGDYEPRNVRWVTRSVNSKRSMTKRVRLLNGTFA
jgi:hypothetical protein